MSRHNSSTKNNVLVLGTPVLSNKYLNKKNNKKCALKQTNEAYKKQTRIDTPTQTFTTQP